jgi:hypothetical protein
MRSRPSIPSKRLPAAQLQQGAVFAFQGYPALFLHHHPMWETLFHFRTVILLKKMSFGIIFEQVNL